MAVCGDMLWVIEAPYPAGLGWWEWLWRLQIGLAAHGFHWEMAAEQFQDCLEKKTFIMYRWNQQIKRQKDSMLGAGLSDHLLGG